LTFLPTNIIILSVGYFIFLKGAEIYMDKTKDKTDTDKNNDNVNINVDEAEPSIDTIKVSVRTVVELILRNGSIDSGNAETNIFDIAAPNTAAIMGGKAHRKIQKSKFEGYKSEVALNYDFEFEEYGFIITLGGRADGVFTDETGTVCIDEIKSAFTPFEFIDGENIIHWGQAMCYAYMYAVKNSVELPPSSADDTPLKEGGKEVETKASLSDEVAVRGGCHGTTLASFDVTGGAITKININAIMAMLIADSA